ncbi:DUF2278 family protein [Kitasatospora sp. MBT63]|uniref:DUF2278 family protein n=1 Tax=Kitasatospora sp. MBT63 TaxID=1444768 RepID=UPI00053A8C60|nr:DUF2278 family protein [Kitasatospora sp. MBT63]
MPLPRYGVAIGTFHDFGRDPRHEYGEWYHGHLVMGFPTGLWEAALDVDSPSGVGVAYRLVPGLDGTVLGALRALPDGFHPLSPDPGSGALDYQRSPFLQDPPWLPPLRLLVRRAAEFLLHPPPGAPVCGPNLADRLAALLAHLRRDIHPWVASDGDNALDVLEPRLRSASRLYVFGQSFADGPGVHDVHLNQGDPVGSQWWDTDGAWQDGAVLCERADGRLTAWQIRFNTQRLPTDDQGHPR